MRILINYGINHSGYIELGIFDLMGREVKSLINEYQTAGNKSVMWDGTNNSKEPVSAGMYLYTLKAGDFIKTKKMILLK